MKEYIFLINESIGYIYNMIHGTGKWSIQVIHNK